MFTLYAYETETGGWVEKKAGLTTDETGELVLQNDSDAPDLLAPNTWYKLVETGAPEGYLKGTTYFYIPPVKEEDTPVPKPEEVRTYTNISLDGTSIHQIPNYKASLRLHKVAEGRPDTDLTGAGFALYDSRDCSGEPLTAAREERTGIYTFDLTGWKRARPII